MELLNRKTPFQLPNRGFSLPQRENSSLRMGTFTELLTKKKRTAVVQQSNDDEDYELAESERQQMKAIIEKFGRGARQYNPEHEGDGEMLTRTEQEFLEKMGKRYNGSPSSFATSDPKSTEMLKHPVIRAMMLVLEQNLNMPQKEILEKYAMINPPQKKGDPVYLFTKNGEPVSVPLKFKEKPGQIIGDEERAELVGMGLLDKPDQPIQIDDDDEEEKN
jgi:hypothetical protein